MLPIDVTHLRTIIGAQVIHDDLSFSVNPGEVMGIVGASGSGKTVLLNTLIGLRRTQGGTIKVLGQDITQMNTDDRNFLRSQCGILFQSGALFGSLTAAENIMAPMIEIAKMPLKLARELALFRLEMVGLPINTALKYPQALSGGMIKRVALARAIACDPKILFLDEPTSGLDPISASHFDALIQNLQKSLNLTVLMITHDLDSLRTICNRISVLVDGHIITGDLNSLMNNQHPWIHSYFHGARGIKGED